MKLPTIVLNVSLIVLFLITIGCSMKSARKSFSEIAIGDNEQIVTEKWGKPDNILTSKGPWGERELWTYICSQISDCDSNCIYVTPCYYVYFENGKIVSIYDAVNW